MLTVEELLAYGYTGTITAVARYPDEVEQLEKLGVKAASTSTLRRALPMPSTRTNSSGRSLRVERVSRPKVGQGTCRGLKRRNVTVTKRCHRHEIVIHQFRKLYGWSSRLDNAE